MGTSVPSASRIPRRQKKPTIPALLFRAQYFGLLAKVAKDLHVHPSVVSRVAAGKKTSARISRALRAEVARLERQAQKKGRAAA